MRSLLTLPLFLALAPPAIASDGVLEINQTCAVNTGCFSGDAAAFPVTITAAGSYRLTSNLTVPNENTDGIVVDASDVGIDLNNFAILGPVTCSGTPLVCSPSSGSGSGVERTAVANRGISVKNGSITGMGSFGVSLGDQAAVTNLRVRWNRSGGISASIGAIISGNAASQNGSSGIFASVGSTISGNTASNNGTDGISSSFASTVSGNTASNNGRDGITARDGSTLSGNTASQNGGDGIKGGGTRCTIIGNAALDNGDATNPTTDDGIQCGGGCIVRGNTVRANAGYGLNLDADSAYSDNVVTANATGTVTGAGIGDSRGGNYCSGTGTASALCP